MFYVSFWSKSKARRGAKSKKRHPSWHCCIAVRSSHHRYSIKKLLLKISQYLQETPLLDSFFKKIAGLKACNFFKKRPQHKRFSVNIAKFLRLHILKNICERLLFDCFNDSLLHGPKGSRSRMYGNVRLQSSSHRSSYLILSRRLSSWAESQPALRPIPLMSQFSVYIGYFWSF